MFRILFDQTMYCVFNDTAGAVPNGLSGGLQLPIFESQCGLSAFHSGIGACQIVSWGLIWLLLTSQFDVHFCAHIVDLYSSWNS